MDLVTNIAFPFTENISQYPNAIQSMVRVGIIKITPARDIFGENLPNYSAVYCKLEDKQYVMNEINNIINKQRYFLVTCNGYEKNGGLLFTSSLKVTNPDGNFFSKKALLENEKKNHKNLDDIIITFVFEFKSKEDCEFYFGKL